MKFQHRQRHIDASKEHKMPRHAKMVRLPMPRRARMCASILRPRMRSSLPHCDCRTALPKSDSHLLIEPSHVAGGGFGGDFGWRRRGHHHVQPPMAIQWPARQPSPFLTTTIFGDKLHISTMVRFNALRMVVFVFTSDVARARPRDRQRGPP